MLKVCALPPILAGHVLVQTFNLYDKRTTCQRSEMPEGLLGFLLTFECVFHSHCSFGINSLSKRLSDKKV